MKKPEFDLFQPFESDYQGHEESVSIYKHFVVMRENYDTDMCPFCNEDVGDCTCEEAKAKFEPLPTMNLQKLVNLVPKDIELDEVKIRTYFDSGDYPTGLYIDAYYTKKVPARPEAYIEDTKAYKEKYAKYKEEVKVYEAWAKQEEIKELEKKLSKLKKA